MKEALHNVIKHSDATQVNLKLEMQAASLAITIADDGVVFDLPKTHNSGNGLGNTQQRMSQIGGLNMNQGPMEHFLVTSYGKVHESILRTESRPRPMIPLRSASVPTEFSPNLS